MATLKAANVTKHDAGGSGDNYIADGYIKSVEKIWIDSYTAATISGTDNTINIAVLPDNKKVVGVEVNLSSVTSQTGGTIQIGHSGDLDAFFTGVVSHNTTISCISLPNRGLVQTVGGGWILPNFNSMPHVTDGTTGTITIRLHNWVTTSATIKSIVRYT
jgi:hypothetical protein